MKNFTSRQWQWMLCEVCIRDALMNILPYWQMVAVEHRHWQMACLAVVCHMDGLVHEGEENEHEGRYQLGVMRNVYTAVYCSAPGYNVHSLSHLVRVPSMLHIILSLRLLPTYIHFLWPDVIHVINVPGLPLSCTIVNVNWKLEAERVSLHSWFCLVALGKMASDSKLEHG